MMSTAPKAFISHATEDKERFVIPFATKLLASGVDAWVDQWEMRPGDSLVTKIFEEGIGNSEYFIIVLSKTSVNKKWVREELNNSFVQSLENKLKLIPVRIDDCDIPISLLQLLRIEIQDINNYDKEFQSLIDRIFDRTNKPPLGNPPAYTKIQIDSIPGLKDIDNIVFKAACEIAINDENYGWVSGNFFSKMQDLDIDEDTIQDILEILDDLYLIKVSRAQQGIYSFQITARGFENYGKKYIDGFSNIVNNVLLYIANSKDNRDYSGDIASYIGQSITFVEFILDMLQERDLIKTIGFMGGSNGSMAVTSITPQGKRKARELSQ